MSDIRLVNWKQGLIYNLLIWTGVAIFTATQWYLGSLAAGRDVSWWLTWSYSIRSSAVWALLTPLIYMVVRFTGFRISAPWPALGIYLLAGLAIAGAHCVIFTPLQWLMAPREPGVAFTGLLLRLLADKLYMNLLVFSIVVAVLLALQAYRDLRERELQAAELQTRLAEAEISALRAQLQPHFLFNTLNAISALVESQPVRAKRLVARLGDLLRISIERHRGQTTTLKDELIFCRAYVAIEKARLGRRLRVLEAISPDSLSARIPALLLQPLIENSIKHGIAPKRGQGTIHVKAAVENKTLHLTISDDGIGTEHIVEHVGLGNARDRLRQLYGSKHRFEIANAPGSGFTVTIAVPQ